LTLLASLSAAAAVGSGHDAGGGQAKWMVQKQLTLRNFAMSSSDKVFSQMTSSFLSVLKFSW
jgi:hypothetical protein